MRVRASFGEATFPGELWYDLGMATLPSILSSITELDVADKRVLRDILNSQLVDHSGTPPAETAKDRPHPMIGLLADDPALADKILESAMHARETRPLRVDGA